MGAENERKQVYDSELLSFTENIAGCLCRTFTLRLYGTTMTQSIQLRGMRERNLCADSF